ncbi:MAG: NAD-binding protein, partial [Lachnospiraceae bacterium]|nr:NAD-binding protein [Lachnospiraceae bacterium]
VLDGVEIMSLGRSISTKVLICAVERDGEVYIPSGNTKLHKDDVISVVASRKLVKSFLEDIGFRTKRVRDTMIIGGGKAAYYLAVQLLHMGISVKIIESDRERCEELSALLPKAIIINGDGTDEELLKEEGIEETQSFVPLTGIDEENIMLTLYARQVSDAKVITKLNRIQFRDVIGQLDLGSVIYPRYITSEAIIAYVRAKKDSKNSNIETLYHMFNHRVEAIEFLVEKKSEVTDIPLMELSLKKNLLISFINRNGTIIIPGGNDCIKVGDTVMIVTTHTGFNGIRDILK